MTKELLQKLIQAESTPDTGELAAANVIADHFRQAGIEACVDIWDDTRANIVAHVKTPGTKPALVFACHLDVVPQGTERWDHPPFSGLEIDNAIYGRGAVDMKGGTAASIAAICQAVTSGPQLAGDIIFAATAGEETDSSGAMRFIETTDYPKPIAGIIIPEPTDFDIVTAHRGMLWLEIATAGKAAHSSTPHLGVNAIAAMKQLLDEFEKFKIPFTPHPQLGDCSMSINRIQGGQAMNIVPDRCTLGIDIRTVPGQDHNHLQAEIQILIDNLAACYPQFKADITVLRSVEPMETDDYCDFVRNFCSAVSITETKAVGFTTDGPHFAELGAPVLIFGPGKPDRCHKPNEAIDIKDLELATNHYKNIIQNFLT